VGEKKRRGREEVGGGGREGVGEEVGEERWEVREEG
jgi:hypothetical protein